LGKKILAKVAEELPHGAQEAERKTVRGKRHKIPPRNHLQ
jgi:hypothetical protein